VPSKPSSVASRGPFLVGGGASVQVLGKILSWVWAWACAWAFGVSPFQSGLGMQPEKGAGQQAGSKSFG
jgi:hypothetical protein